MWSGIRNSEVISRCRGEKVTRERTGRFELMRARARARPEKINFDFAPSDTTIPLSPVKWRYRAAPMRLAYSCLICYSPKIPRRTRRPAAPDVNDLAQRWIGRLTKFQPSFTRRWFDRGHSRDLYKLTLHQSDSSPSPPSTSVHAS